jgi:FG-GAP-like repeat
VIHARTTATALLLAATAAGQEFASSTYAVPASTTRLALRDMDGDGRRDLLAVDHDGLALRRLHADGTLAGEDESTFAWPSDTTGWALADLDGDGATEVLLLVDGRHVSAVRADAQGVLAAGAPLLENPQGFLPRGVRRVNFVRDVDGDGRLDLVLPGNGRYLIHRNLGAEGFAPVLAVAFRADIDTELGDPGRLDSRFSQDVQIPWFELRDVDGDGSTDLVSETVDEVLVHLAQPALPVQPSWSLDLAALRTEMPARETIDLDNLLANVEPQITWRTANLDGVAPDDVVLQTGGTFRVYLGGSTGPTLARPSQVLRASGNVLYFLLRDVNGDGRPDLQLLRAASISIGDALRLLVVPGSLDFDVFTYLDVQGSPDSERGEVFARRPTARTTVSLHIPALLGFLDDVEELEADYKMRRAVPAAALALDDDGALNDVADLNGGQLTLWRDRVPAGFQGSLRERLASFDVDDLLEEYVISELDHMGDGGRLDIGLEDIRKLMVTPGWDLRQAVKDEPPVAQIPLSVPVERARLRIEDLDGDGRSDIVITGDTDEGGHRVVEFFVRK